MDLSLTHPPTGFVAPPVVALERGVPAASGEPATVMEVLRRFGPDYLLTNPPEFERNRLQKILDCRTGKHGWHIFVCTLCGHQHTTANRCGQRHCPDCTRGKSWTWLEKVIGWCLPINYLHLVFTLPHCLNDLIAQNPLLLTHLMNVVCRLLTAIAKKTYGCKAGFLVVLHTWGQEMKAHFHAHVLLTSGGLSLDGTKWISMHEDDRALQPYRLARVFRKWYLQGLIERFNAGELKLPPGMLHLTTESDLRDWLRCCYRHSWVNHVDGAPPGLEGPGAALKYLAAYAHATAIKDGRIVSMTDTHVTIKVKDYRRDIVRNVTMRGTEFVRRFALHFLPQTVTRIRYCGLFHGRKRITRLDQCRAVLRRQGLIRDDQLHTPGPPMNLNPGMACTSCGLPAMKHKRFCYWREDYYERLFDYELKRLACTIRVDTRQLARLTRFVFPTISSVTGLRLGEGTFIIAAPPMPPTVVDTTMAHHLHGPSP